MTQDTVEELRQRNEQETNETPELDEGDDDGDGGGFAGEIPTPSVDRKLLIGVAIVVGLIIAWKVYQSQQSGGSSETLDDVRASDMDPEVTAETPDEDDEITVRQDSTSPLAADEDVTQAFLERGILSESEE